MGKEILNRNSAIVEICSDIMYKPNEVKNEDYQKAQAKIKELASVPNPNNLFELAQIVGFLVDDRFMQDTQYIDLIADVKKIAEGEKARFKMKKGTVTALWQAKGSTAQRSAVGTAYKTLDTDEISCAPSIELEQMRNGQIDFSSLVADASRAMENKLITQIETVIEAAWDDLGSPWYASASGVTSAIDPLITAVGRLGSPVIMGDVAAIAKFIGLSGFQWGTASNLDNSSIPNSMREEFHRTGITSFYRGAKLMQLVNPLMNDTDMTTTLLDQGYLYIVPAGASREDRPIKVVYEGDIDTYENKLVQSRILEIPMYKKVGVGIASTRNGFAFFEDTSL